MYRKGVRTAKNITNLAPFYKTMACLVLKSEPRIFSQSSFTFLDQDMTRKRVM